MHQRSLSELQGVSSRLWPRGAAPLWAWLLLGTLLVPGARSFLSEEQEELLVELHNHYRGSVTPSASAMMPLKWDPSLKIIAEGYAAKCIWNHNSELEDTGENLYAKTGPLDLREALEKWFMEHLDYDFHNNSCDEDKMCGHYTQMVWADTHRVGCAFHLCNNMEGLDWERVSFLVCNYFPPGNYEDVRPYVEGDWCSRCPENLQKCENNLCVADTEEEDNDDDDENGWGTVLPPPATTDPSPQDGDEGQEDEVGPPRTNDVQPDATPSPSPSPSEDNAVPDTAAPGTLPPSVPSTAGEDEAGEETEEDEDRMETEDRMEKEDRMETEDRMEKEDRMETEDRMEKEDRMETEDRMEAAEREKDVEQTMNNKSSVLVSSLFLLLVCLTL